MEKSEMSGEKSWNILARVACRWCILSIVSHQRLRLSVCLLLGDGKCELLGRLWPPDLFLVKVHFFFPLCNLFSVWNDTLRLCEFPVPPVLETSPHDPWLNWSLCWTHLFDHFSFFYYWRIVVVLYYVHYFCTI